MDKIIKDILEGKIFIYPTDTIYGLGCNAEYPEAVEKIKQIKFRDKAKPMSIIAPGFEWIKENCIVDVDLEKYLPGPYTLILKKKNPDFLNHISQNEFLGVRIPDCVFSEYVEKSESPFITTSVNLAGEPFAKSIKEVPEKIKEQVEIIIDEGELNGEPSTLIKDGKEMKR
jgi:L-threonylcarbamoyladenylate synthase